MHCRKWSVAVFAFLLGPRLVSFSQTITSIYPNPAPAGATVSIAGTGFGALGTGSILTADGSSIPFATWSPTLITAVVPSNSVPGSYSIGVTTNGTSSNTQTLTVTGAPTITSLSPNPAAPGGVVTIAGNNFGSPSNTSELTVEGSSFAWSTWSNTAITAVVPAGLQSGSAVVGVTVDGVSSNTMTEMFQPVAQVTGVSPNPVSVCSTVTVAGSNFGSSQGASILTFDGNAFPASTWGENTITAVVPLGSAAGTGSVGVTVGGVPSNTASLTVNNNPNFLLSPNIGPPQMGILITDCNLATEGMPTVTFNGVDVPPFSVTSSSFAIQVPANAAPGNATIVITSGSVSIQTNFTVTAPLGCPTS